MAQQAAADKDERVSATAAGLEGNGNDSPASILSRNGVSTLPPFPGTQIKQRRR